MFLRSTLYTSIVATLDDDHRLGSAAVACTRAVVNFFEFHNKVYYFLGVWRSSIRSSSPYETARECWSTPKAENMSFDKHRSARHREFSIPMVLTPLWARPTLARLPFYRGNAVDFFQGVDISGGRGAARKDVPGQPPSFAGCFNPNYAGLLWGAVWRWWFAWWTRDSDERGVVVAKQKQSEWKLADVWQEEKKNVKIVVFAMMTILYKLNAATLRR